MSNPASSILLYYWMFHLSERWDNGPIRMLYAIMDGSPNGVSDFAHRCVALWGDQYLVQFLKRASNVLRDKFTPYDDVYPMYYVFMALVFCELKAFADTEMREQSGLMYTLLVGWQRQMCAVPDPDKATIKFYMTLEIIQYVLSLLPP